MLCSRFKQIIITNPSLNNNKNYRCFNTKRLTQKKCWTDIFLASFIKKTKYPRSMTSMRFLIKDLVVNRLWSVWSRNVNNVRRLRRDRTVREVIFCFRQAILRPKRTLLLSAAAVYNVKADEYKPPPCQNTITDSDLQNKEMFCVCCYHTGAIFSMCKKYHYKSLLSDFEGVEDLSRRTLYCTKCKKRLVIEKKLPGIVYCICEESSLPEPSKDGWMPYLEADSVIIWRKEYKPGQGLYAYKVFGKYTDVVAADYAAVQVDGAYRREWDSAVAALSVVERAANGVPDQTVLHWEVLWPRFFTNRDYVYIRRHKQFEIGVKNIPKTDTIKQTDIPKEPDTKPDTSIETNNPEPTEHNKTVDTNIVPDTKKTEAPDTNKHEPDKTKKQEERQSVHSKAKRKSLEAYENREQEKQKPKLPWLKNYNCLSDLEKPKLPWYKSDEEICEKERSCDKTCVEKSVNANSGVGGLNTDKIENTAVTNENTAVKNENTAVKNENTAVKNENTAVKNENTVVKSDKTSDMDSNKAYVIVSRSCVHPKAPVTSHAIRVNEYWSNMVIRSVRGEDNSGMEFVLTYYDEPGTGGLPTGVASWVTGRGAPAYLARMKQAARDYREYRRSRGTKVAQDYLPFGPEKVSFEDTIDFTRIKDIRPQPSLSPELTQLDKSTQTDDVTVEFKFKLVDVKVVTETEQTVTASVLLEKSKSEEKKTENKKEESQECEEEENSDSWWKQMYPFYYFV